MHMQGLDNCDICALSGMVLVWCVFEQTVEANSFGRMTWFLVFKQFKLNDHMPCTEDTVHLTNAQTTVNQIISFVFTLSIGTMI